MFNDLILFIFEFLFRPRAKSKKGKKEEEDDNESMTEQSVVHPNIIKEFLLRFPEYGTRLMLLMVQTGLKENINWKKRVKYIYY